MSSSKSNVEAFRHDFEEKLKAKICIAELYTRLTGEEFIRTDARARARIVWRQDTNPSLCWYPNENLLTDFTGQNPNSSKAGISYNVFDILMKVGGALNRTHAVQMACEIAGEEFPKEFQIRDAETKSAYNLGKKIQEVWQLCKDKLNFYIDNPSKCPSHITEFFKERNIPFDKTFVEVMNIGILPQYDDVKAVLQGHSILPKDEKTEGEEKMIFRKSLSENALVYPLYNQYGALAGLKFRQMNAKDFAFWCPVTKSCFYNMHRFSRRPRGEGRHINFCEGEGNVLAFGIAAYKFYKNQELSNEDLKVKLDEAMCNMFCTGSKDSKIDILKNEVNFVNYFPDYDVTDITHNTNFSTHPIMRTAILVAEQLQAKELLIVDWSNIPNVFEKFDLADFLKSVDYDVSKIQELRKISLARYIAENIQRFLKYIKDKDNLIVTQLMLIDEMSKQLPHPQQQSFTNVCKELFPNIEEKVIDNFAQAERRVEFGPFRIDQRGYIVERVVTNKDEIREVACTNFYCRIAAEANWFNTREGKMDKFYEVEIVRDNRVTGTGELTPDEIIDPKKINEFVAKYDSVTNCRIMEDDFSYKTVMQLMNQIPPRGVKCIFDGLGRPFAEFNIARLKTQYFCLMPKVSVINGEVIPNTGFEVQLGKHTQIAEVSNAPRYEWSLIDDDSFKESANLFWNHLRHVHDTHLMDSLISLHVDSCCREMMGYTELSTDHGFTFFIHGRTGTHKTTAGVCSMYLVGKFTDKTVFHWNNTDNQIEILLRKVGTQVALMDELKAEIIADKTYISIFHAVYGGSSRGRLAGRNHEESGNNPLECSLIVTAEGPPTFMPESIASRILCIRVSPTSIDIKDQRKVHLNELRTGYQFEGFVGPKGFLLRGFMPRMIAWIQKRGQKPYMEGLVKWRNEFKEVLGDDKGQHVRTVEMVTRLVTAFETVSEFCTYVGVCTKDEALEAFKDFVKFWKVEIRHQVVRVESHSSTHFVVKLLGELVSSDSPIIKSFVIEGDRGKWKLQEAGRFRTPLLKDIMYPDGSRKLLIIATQGLIRELEKMSNTKILQEKFIQDCIETGLIDNDNGKPVRYVQPDERGNWPAKNAKSTQTYIGIDYDKLMQMYFQEKEH